MAIIRPVYRLTLFQPKSQDPTESAPLVPAAGAPHADAFKVATHRLPGDASGIWKPYLAMPRGGRRSRIDPITKKADVGSMTAELTDVKLAADNDSERWLSAFIGDTNGTEQLKHLRAQWEESLDGGFTWLPFWAGRTQDVESVGRLGVRIPMRDEVDRFKVPLFVGRPHASITDAWQAPLLPIGRMTLVPGISAKKSLQAPQDTTYLDMTATGEDGGFPHWFTPNYVDATKRRWNLTQALVDKAADVVKALYIRVLHYDPGTVQLEVEDAGSVLGRFNVRGIVAVHHDDLFLVQRIAVEELPAVDPDHVVYPALSTVYGGALVTAAADGPTEATPLFIGAPFEINVVTLIAAILDGKFGRLDQNGDPLDAIRRRTASFSALASVIPYTFRDRITAETTIDEWLPKHLLEPFDLALIPDAEGYLDLVSLARPSTVLTPASITDAEIVADPDAEHWRHSDKDVVNAVEVKTNYWQIADLDDLLERARDDSDGYVDAPPGLIDVTEYPPLQFLYADQGEDSRAFDFGFQNHETYLTGMVPGDALEYGRIHARDLFARFGVGAHYVTYRRRRTAADGTKLDPGCDVGSRRSLETSGVPDLATHDRGINRLGLCIERQPDPGWVDLTFLDEGPNAQAADPTLGVLVLADGTVVGTVVDPVHSVVVDAPTMNAAGDPIRIDIAVTDAGAGLPAHSSSLWQTVTDPGYKPDGVTPLVIRGQPNGQRVWVRGRSEPLSGSARLPSSWVFPAPDSVVLDALTAPSALIISNIGPTSAHLTWTLGESDLPLGILVEDALVDTLEAGSTSYDLTGVPPGAGLTPNTNYDVAVVHIDAVGGYTAAATGNFNTLASGAALPRPAGLQVLVPSAITLALFAADSALPFVIQRAPDSAGAPDLGSIETIADGLPGSTTRYTDAQPVGPTVWWYRLAHGSGAALGPFTEWVSATAQSGETPPETYIRPAVDATPSETPTDGTVTLTIEDPQLRVTAVEFRAREGTGSWSGWVADTAPYSATVPITAGGTSQIGWRVLGYDETGTVITLASGTETFGASTDILSAPVLTSAPATSTFPNSRELLAGTGIAFDDATPGQRVISSTGGGGGSSTLIRRSTIRFRLPHAEAGTWAVWPSVVAADIVEVELQNEDGSTCTSTVEIEKASDAGFPTFADITGGHDAVITADDRVVDDTLTDWMPGLIAGDTLRARIATTDKSSGNLIVTLTTEDELSVAVAAPRLLVVGNVLRTAGERARIPIDTDCTITAGEIQGSVDGMSAVIDVYRATDADIETFTKIGTLELSSASPPRAVDSTASGFTATAIAAGDTLEFRLISLSEPADVSGWVTLLVGTVQGVGGFSGTVPVGDFPLVTGAQTLGGSELKNGIDNIEVGRSLLLEKGLVHPPTVVSANATLTHAHYLVIVTANATITLPAAASSTGRAYQIVPVAGVTATVDPDGAELIDGAATLALTSGALIACDGTGWHAVAKAAGGVGGAAVGDFDYGPASALAGIADHFDSSTLDPKWTVTADTMGNSYDVNTTVKSALVAKPTGTDQTLSLRQDVSIAGDVSFTIIGAMAGAANFNSLGLYLYNSTGETDGVLADWKYSSGYKVAYSHRTGGAWSFDALVETLPSKLSRLCFHVQRVSDVWRVAWGHHPYALYTISGSHSKSIGTIVRLILSMNTSGNNAPFVVDAILRDYIYIT